MKPIFQFNLIGGLKVDARPVVVPLAIWHQAANEPNKYKLV